MSYVDRPSQDAWVYLMPQRLEMRSKEIPNKFLLKLVDIKFLMEELDANSARELYLCLMGYFVGDVSHDTLLITLNEVLTEYISPKNNLIKSANKK